MLTTAGPDIQMVSTTETNFETVTINYDVETAVSSFRVAIYRSATTQFDPTVDRLITTATLTGANVTPGNHTAVPINIPGGLEPDPSHPYVFAQATGPDQQSTHKDFQKVVIAAVTHGFLIPFSSYPPAWVTQMANSLSAEHFNDVIPFGWGKSWVPKSGVATGAGDALAQEILAAVQNPTIVPAGAVVDIELIGHSRGGAVVNQAFTDLQADAATVPKLAGGYWREVLLDPHPANSATDNLFDYSYLGAVAYYTWAVPFQYLTADPYPIQVPSMVSEVQDYYESTPVSELGPHWGLRAIIGYTENYIDPQGVPPSGIDLEGKNTIFNSQSLTVPGVGHGEVHEWYQEFVVPTLYKASPFVTGPRDAPLRPESYYSLTAHDFSISSDQIVRYEDADPSSHPADFSIAIFWGDGSASRGKAIKATVWGGYDVQGAHTYPRSKQSKDYTVTVHINDVAPNFGGSSITLTNTVSVGPSQTTAFRARRELFFPR
jgi:hypothetical protein